MKDEKIFETCRIDSSKSMIFLFFPTDSYGNFTDNFRLSVKNKVTTTICFSDDTEKKQTRFKTICDDIISNIVGSTISDFGIGYIEQVARKLAYRSLNTIFTNSGNPKIFDMMKDLVFNYRSSFESESRRIQYLANSQVIQGYFGSESLKNPKTNSDYKRIEQEKYFADNGISSFEKYHYKRKVVDNDGIGHMVECIPYVTRQNTVYGTTCNKVYQVSNCNDSEDVLQIARLTLYELVSLGLIHNFSDVWHYKNLIYKRINSYIISEKHSVNFSSGYSSYSYDENNNVTEKRFSEKSIEKIVDSISIDQIASAVSEYLSTNTRMKDESIKQTIVIFGMLLNGLDTRTIASELNISQNLVMRRKESIKNAISNSEVYELLHSALN